MSTKYPMKKDSTRRRSSILNQCPLFSKRKKSTNGAIENTTNELGGGSSDITVPYYQLFRFSTGYQKALTIAGLFAAFFNGLPIPILLLVYGKTIDEFVPNQFCKILDFINISGICPPHVDETNINQLFHECDWSNFNVTLPDLTKSTSKRAIQFTIIGLVSWVLSTLQTLLLSNSAEQIIRNVRIRCFEAVLSKQVSWFDKNSSGSINSVLNETTEKFKNGIGDKVGMVTQGILVTVAALSICFICEWKLSLAMICFAPLLVVAISFLAKKTVKGTFLETKAYAKTGSVAQETFAGIRTVHAYNGTKKMQNIYDSKLDDAYKEALIKGSLTCFVTGLLWFVIFSSYAIGFWYGGKLMISDNMSVGLILIIFFSVQTAVFTLGNNTSHYSSITESRSAASTIYKLIDDSESVERSLEDRDKKIKGSGDITRKSSSALGGNRNDDFIVFQNISFSYPSRPDVEILSNINLSIRKGSTVALVGESGCGKSTIVQLLLRFYNPSSGQICINGIPMQNIDISELRNLIGLVGQEPVLFSMSIKENILLGNANATEDEIRYACKQANALQFIEQFPDKFDTLVGEGGSRLSGGQKQRIAIARALVSNPEILLIDEATNAFDSENERLVQSALDNARRGRTTLIIAHRLSTIRNADVITGIRRGRVVEYGTHVDLIKTNGVYNQLVNAQHRNDESKVENPVRRAGQSLLVESSPLTRITSDVETTNSYESSIFFTKELKLFSRDRITSSIIVDGKKSSSNDETKKALMFVMKANMPEIFYICLGTICIVGWGVLQIVFQVFFAQTIVIFSNCNDEMRQNNINRQSLIFFIIGISCFIAQFGGTLAYTVSGERLSRRLRSQVFKYLTRQEIGFFDKSDNGVGKLCTILSTEASAVQGATGIRIGTYLSGISILLVGIIVAFIYGWQLALVILAFVPILIGAGVVSMKVISGFSAQDKKYLEEAGRIVVECTSNIRTVKQLKSEKYFMRRYVQLIDNVMHRNLRKTVINGILFGFSQGVVFFVVAGCYYAGAVFINHGYMNTEEMMIVFGSLLFGAMSIGQNQAMAPDFGKSIEAAKRIYKIIQRVPKIDSESTDGLIPKEYNGIYKLDHVKFNYPAREQTQVLRNVTLTIDSSTSSALVGFSGCGKSTIIQLLERFYDPTEGCIFLDDVDIRTINIHWYRQKIGIVSQEPILFNWSIGDNIAFGDQINPPNMKRIRAAAKAANIDDFITHLPQGYDTIAGSRGSLLSGGQKQRICLARALVSKPALILLDEATSALDTENERIVQEALFAAQQERGSVTVSHRLSIIEHSDVIYVMDNGKLVECGNHVELLNNRGTYYDLCKYSKR